MSIHESIKEQCAGGALVLLTPLVSGAPTVRHMFLSSEVSALVCGPWNGADQTWKNRRFVLRQQLEDFITGSLITVARKPRKAKTAYMSQLDMPSDRVWDIRARDPEPGIRILGGFAECDVFVATNWAFRKPLGVYGSQQWKKAIATYHGQWAALFKEYLPISDNKEISEDNLHDYISTNCKLLG